MNLYLFDNKNETVSRETLEEKAAKPEMDSTIVRLKSIDYIDVLACAMVAEELALEQENLAIRNKYFNISKCLKRIAQNLQILKRINKLED